MYLKDVIARLEQEDPTRVVPHGFHNPHSYRGNYNSLALTPKDGVTVGEMLTDVRAALGAEFSGYKGGMFQMQAYTDVWLAEYGCGGEQLGPRLLEYILTEEPPEG